MPISFPHNSFLLLPALSLPPLVEQKLLSLAVAGVPLRIWFLKTIEEL